jgi:hypothetical protein
MLSIFAPSLLSLLKHLCSLYLHLIVSWCSDSLNLRGNLSRRQKDHNKEWDGDIKHNMPDIDEDDFRGSVARRQPVSFRTAIADTSNLPSCCRHTLAGLSSQAATPTACHCRDHRTFSFHQYIYKLVISIHVMVWCYLVELSEGIGHVI